MYYIGYEIEGLYLEDKRKTMYCVLKPRGYNGIIERR